MTEQTVVTTVKPWYTSRTVWLNGILILVGLAMYILEGIESGELQSPWAIDEAQLTFWYGLLNMILRFMTTQPVVTGSNS